MGPKRSPSPLQTPSPTVQIMSVAMPDTARCGLPWGSRWSSAQDGTHALLLNAAALCEDVIGRPRTLACSRGRRKRAAAVPGAPASWALASATCGSTVNICTLPCTDERISCLSVVLTFLFTCWPGRRPLYFCHAYTRRSKQSCRSRIFAGLHVRRSARANIVMHPWVSVPDLGTRGVRSSHGRQRHTACVPSLRPRLQRTSRALARCRIGPDACRPWACSAHAGM